MTLPALADLLALADNVESPVLVGIFGVVGTALTTLSSVIVSQMSSLKHELASMNKQLVDTGTKHTQELKELRASTARADAELAERIDRVEEDCGLVPERRRPHASTPRGRRPSTRPGDR